MNELRSDIVIRTLSMMRSKVKVSWKDLNTESNEMNSYRNSESFNDEF